MYGCEDKKLDTINVNTKQEESYVRKLNIMCRDKCNSGHNKADK